MWPEPRHTLPRDVLCGLWCTHPWGQRGGLAGRQCGVCRWSPTPAGLSPLLFLVALSSPGHRPDLLPGWVSFVRVNSVKSPPWTSTLTSETCRSHVCEIPRAGGRRHPCLQGPQQPTQGCAMRTSCQVPPMSPGPGQGRVCGVSSPTVCHPRSGPWPPLPEDSPWLSHAPCSHMPHWFSVIPISQTEKRRPTEGQQLVWVTRCKQRRSESLGPRPQTTLLLCCGVRPAGKHSSGQGHLQATWAKNIPDACRLGCVYAVPDPPTANSQCTAGHLVGVAASWEQRVRCDSARGAWCLLREFLIPASARVPGVSCHGVWKATVATGHTMVDFTSTARPRCPRVRSPNTGLEVAWRYFQM